MAHSLLGRVLWTDLDHCCLNDTATRDLRAWFLPDIQSESWCCHVDWTLYQTWARNNARAQVFKCNDAILQYFQEFVPLLHPLRLQLHVLLLASVIHGTWMGWPTIIIRFYWTFLLLWVHEFDVPHHIIELEKTRHQRKRNPIRMGLPIRLLRKLLLGIIILVDIRCILSMCWCLSLLARFNPANVRMGSQKTQKLQERIQRELPTPQSYVPILALIKDSKGK